MAVNTDSLPATSTTNFHRGEGEGEMGRLGTERWGREGEMVEGGEELGEGGEEMGKGERDGRGRERWDRKGDRGRRERSGREEKMGDGD